MKDGWWDLENRMVASGEPGEIPYTDVETSEQFLEPDEYDLARQEAIDDEAERQAGVDCHNAVLGIAEFMGAHRSNWLTPNRQTAVAPAQPAVRALPISRGGEDK